MRYTTMEMEAMPMMTTKKAFTTRLSLCRKRIMDGLGPSALYARSWCVVPFRREAISASDARGVDQPQMRSCRPIFDWRDSMPL